MMTPKKYTAMCIGLAATILLSGCNSGRSGSAGVEIRDGDRLTSFSQEITSPIQEFNVKAGDAYTLAITAKNTGTQPWFGGNRAMSVDVGYRWRDINGNMLPIEGNRAPLDRPVVHPGESDSVKLEVVAPPNPGSYTLLVSMVQEGVAWFFSQGTKPLALNVTVD